MCRRATAARPRRRRTARAPARAARRRAAARLARRRSDRARRVRAPARRSSRRVERLGVELLGGVDLVEPERDLGVEQRPILGQDVPVEARREPVLADTEPPTHLAEQLQRRNPLAGLDARDVRGRAALERELALAQSGALTRVPQPCGRPPQGRRHVLTSVSARARRSYTTPFPGPGPSSSAEGRSR